jgi:CHAD domain-containing protein
MAIHHPRSILRSRLQELSSLLSGVRNVDIDAIHDARVVTRELRELLPIMDLGDSQSADAMARIRKAGRVMGEVRELDVLHSLLDDLDGRATFAAQALAHMRQDARRARDTARRRMVKELEPLELDRIERQLLHRSKWPRLSNALPFRPRWRGRLRARVGRRAAALADALQRISGVYMPNRSHAARVAVKKLRYGVKIAGETAVWQVPEVEKALRRAQATLGDIHDLQVLVDRAERKDPDDGDSPEWAWLRDLLRSDIANQHRSFIERRERLESAVRACAHWARPQNGRWPMRSLVVLPVAASAAVVPLLAKSRR